MSRSKSSLAHKPVAAAAPEAVAVNLTTDLSQVEAMPSPALDLQENLRQAWMPATGAGNLQGRAPVQKARIPIGWGLAVAALGSGAVWAGLAVAVAKLF
ncbi:MAG: hypothetical protein ACXU8U_07515 [Asticcacaulis sp.]